MSAIENRRSVTIAVVAAVVLMGASGVGYRVFARYLARPTDSTPLPPGTLARLPRHIGQWVGKDVPLEEALIAATDTDAIVNRVYSRTAGGEVVALFIGYGVQARDLMPHRPEVCYPGAGWTLNDNDLVQLALRDGTTLDCRIYRFSRGALSSQDMTVLNYYIVDGQYCPDVSLLRSRAWRGSKGIRYMAQVQIACSDSPLRGASGAVESVRSFAAEAAQAIRCLFTATAASSPTTRETLSDEG